MHSFSLRDRVRGRGVASELVMRTIRDIPQKPWQSFSVAPFMI